MAAITKRRPDELEIPRQHGNYEDEIRASGRRGPISPTGRQVNSRSPIGPQSDRRSATGPPRDRESSGETAAPSAPGGFVGLLARNTVDTALRRGTVSAICGLLRAETFLRSYRDHLLETPADARSESYNLGLIAIELMIMRESLGIPGTRST
jgi:hypothetical protein